jgi:D-glycero-beta-D-manno-heptose-7-phosphate kinase
MMDIDKLFSSFRDVKVGVLGDVMIDSYMWGRVDRISPEAPVPVVALKKKEFRIGGAGNVALNLIALGADVSVLSVIGQDEEGDILRRMFGEAGINTEHLLGSHERITTNKTRIISRNQQMLRLDNEMTTDLSYQDESMLKAAVDQYLEGVQPHVLIFEDYNKGVLTTSVIEYAINRCKDLGILTSVDPKRKNFFAYNHVTIFKPNLKEVWEGLNILSDEVTIDSLSRIHEALKEKLNHEISFITLSEKGVFYDNSLVAEIIPSHVRNIADVSGAGDTVIAVASLVYAATRNVKLMAEVSNLAGGLVCEEVGTAAIDKEKLLRECKLVINQ